MKMEAPPWEDVMGEEWQTSTRVLSERLGPNKTVRRIEEVMEKYVALSCGHRIRWTDFAHGGKERKRVRCWDCQAEIRATSIREGG